MARPFALFSFLALLSCENKSNTGGQPTPAQIFSPAMTKVVLEVDYAEGAEPYTGSSSFFGGGDTWQLFQANAARLFEGQTKTLTIPTQLSQMEALGPVAGDDFTSEQILALATAHRSALNSADTASYYLIWLNGYFRDGSGARNNVLGVSLGTTGVIALFKPVIESTRSLFVPNIERTVEQSTLVHEFGHALGLVNNGISVTSAHHDTAHGAHCTNTDCVMYWANEGPSNLSDFVTQSVTTGTSVIFGAECLNDVDALK